MFGRYYILYCTETDASLPLRASAAPQFESPGAQDVAQFPGDGSGITDRLWSTDDVIARIDAMAPPPKPRGRIRNGLDMHPEIHERLTRETEELIPLTEQRWFRVLEILDHHEWRRRRGSFSPPSGISRGTRTIRLGLTAVLTASVEVFARSVVSCPPAEEPAGQLISN